MASERTLPAGPPPRPAAAGALALLLLGGCAGVEYGSAAYDPARMPATAEVAERTQYRGYNYLRPVSAYREAVAARIAELARAPMTEAAAVEVALLQDAGVQDLAQGYWAQRPSFVAAVAESAADAEDPRATEWRVLGELVSRSRTPRWRVEFGEEYLGAAETVLDTAMHARVAFHEAVAAAQLAAMFDQTLQAEKAAAELANEQYRSGTASRLDQARRHLAYAETFKAAAEARREAVAKREALNRTLKLWGAQTAWALPDRLPDLPAERPELGDVEAYAATHSVAAYAGRADPAQFEAGAVMRSEVREAYNRLLTAYDIARHQRDVVVPLTQTALGEMQLNYNAMLEDVYELLDATREQIEVGKEYVETLAEFWVAHAELTQLLGGRLPEAPATTTAAANQP
jgi:hypothetical protein